VCRALVRTLQQRGYRWHLPTSAPVQNDDADCVSGSFDKGEGTLRIQHVRVITNEATWRTLAQAKQLSQVIASTLDAAGTLREAIDKKAKPSTAVQRANLTLALDATTASVYSLGGVVRAFRENHGGWCQALGFATVWLVGPSGDLTYRLDVRDPADAV
jgi:hypothetical protein